jgi:hypothetical protein
MASLARRDRHKRATPHALSQKSNSIGTPKVLSLTGPSRSGSSLGIGRSRAILVGQSLEPNAGGMLQDVGLRDAGKRVSRESPTSSEIASAAA